MHHTLPNQFFIYAFGAFAAFGAFGARGLPLHLRYLNNNRRSVEIESFAHFIFNEVEI